jgi:hypothetical protein
MNTTDDVLIRGMNQSTIHSNTITSQLTSV